MELRRALLLFAIVLGLAAVAATFLRPAPERSREPRATTPRLAPRASPGGLGEPQEEIEFAAGARPATKRLVAGHAATVTVRSDEAGQVELEGLGLGAAVEPLTPARVDVLADRPGRYRVRFLPAGGEKPRTVGVLAVEPPSAPAT